MGILSDYSKCLNLLLQFKQLIEELLKQFYTKQHQQFQFSILRIILTISSYTYEHPEDLYLQLAWAIG